MRGIALAVYLAAGAMPCAGFSEEMYGAPPRDLDRRLDGLTRAYPDWIAGHEGTLLLMKDGTKLRISDGRTDKSFDELLERPDIDDMFYAEYPLGEPAPPARNADPGRVRFEPLFAAMYGDCRKGQVGNKLHSIEWLPRHRGGFVAITTVNGVDKALDAVSHELDALPDRFTKYLKPNSGTYNCRDIAGSTARSMHAYGAAIDINDARADYWRWSRAPRWRNRIPLQIVRVFERHGFIWGGAWYHYDTMHFEYRPELLP